MFELIVDLGVTQICAEGLTTSTDTQPHSQMVDVANQKEQYVYAIRREGFKGNTLFPLNQMKEMDGFQDIYAKQIQKYEGREYVKENIISVLDCLWNDVVFFSS